MKTKNAALILTTATVALMASTFAALAVPAVAKSQVNVRTGPSTSYNRIDALQRGEHVEVVECKSGWCYVQHNGPDGWVSGNYLQAPNNYNHNNNNSGTINFGLTFGTGGPNVSITFGNNTPQQPTRIHGPRVCFFEKNHYHGQSYCVAAGEENNRLTGFWNNNISSIKVYNGARVHVCESSNNTGACYGYGSNISRLPSSINNNISAYRTWR